MINAGSVRQGIEGGTVADYLTCAAVQAVRTGSTTEILIGPGSPLEVFPDLASPDSSLLLKEAFSSLSTTHDEWQSWILLLKIGGSEPIEAELWMAPIIAKLKDDKCLGTATSVFEKQQKVLMKLSRKGATKEFELLDIERVKER